MLSLRTCCRPKKLCSETCEAPHSARTAFCFAVPDMPSNSLMNFRTVMSPLWAMCAAMYLRNRLLSYQRADVGHDGSHLFQVRFDALASITTLRSQDTRRVR